MDLDAAIRVIEAAAGDPREGLPEQIFLFISGITPLINVDLLIQDNAGRTLLSWRDDQYFGTGWHIPGGVIRYKEMAVDRIHACARHELGATVTVASVPLLVSEYISDKSTRGHAISLLYRCTLLTPPEESRRASSHAPRPGEWRWHDRCPPDLLSAQAHYGRFL